MQNQTNANTAAALKAEFDALQAELRFAEAIGDEDRAKKAQDAIAMFVVRNPKMMEFATAKATSKFMNRKILTRVSIGVGLAIGIGLGGVVFARR